MSNLLVWAGSDRLLQPGVEVIDQWDNLDEMWITLVLHGYQALSNVRHTSVTRGILDSDIILVTSRKG